MFEISCRWAKGQLPLWVGGDLIGTDRRRVERHLLHCPDCRIRRDALTQSLSAIHVLATDAPRRAVEPASLWPSLAQQIQESRHPALGAISWWRLLGWPMTGLGTAALLVGGMVVMGRPKPAPSSTTQNSVAAQRPALPAGDVKDRSSETLSAKKVETETDTPLAPVPLPIPSSSREPQPSS